MTCDGCSSTAARWSRPATIRVLLGWVVWSRHSHRRTCIARAWRWPAPGSIPSGSWRIATTSRPASPGRCPATTSRTG